MTVSQPWRCPTCSGFGQAQALTFGRLVVCPRQLVAYLDGRPLPLTRLEILLLCYLAERAGSVCRWDEILAAVWGPDWPGVEEWRGSSERHLLGVHISRLRRQLGPMGGLIETRLNVGYLMPDPDTVSDTVPYVGRPPSAHAGALQREILECLRARARQWVSVEAILQWVRQTRPLRHRHHVATSISRLPLHERSVQVRYRGTHVSAAMLSERSL